MISKFSLTMSKEKPPKKKVEVFNFRNKVNPEKFRAATSYSPSLSDLFDTEEDINVQTEKFL